MAKAVENKQEVRWCPVDHIDELQQFIGQHWRKDHILARDRELLEWQHARNTTTISFLVARSGDAIDGVLGVIPTDWNYYGQRLKANWLALWCARNDAPAGTGLRLMAEARKRVQVVGVLGVSKQAVPIYRQLKFGLLPSVTRYVRKFSLWARAEGARTLPANPAVSRVDCSGEVVSPIGGRMLQVSPQTWTETWSERFAPQCVSNWKNEFWLRRRYVRHPRFAYQVDIMGDDRDGRWVEEACAVYRIAELEPGRRMMRVVEFIAAGDTGRLLTLYLCRTAERYGCEYADFYCTSGRFAAPLVAAGFSREIGDETDYPAMLSPPTYDHARLNGAFHCSTDIVDSNAAFMREHLYLTRGDGDQDRPN